METLIQDLRHSFRMFRENPAFSLTAIAALALGIGVNVAIFTVVNAVLLKPVPFPEPDRLVLLMNTSPQGQGANASPAKFMHWRQQTEVLEDVAAFRNGTMNYTGGDLPEQVRIQQASEGIFRALGRDVILGRSFLVGEDLPGGPRAVLLAENYWQERFAGDPGLLGTDIELDGDFYTVVGIASEEPNTREFGAMPQVFTAFQLDPRTSDQGHYFQVVGRLRDGVSLAQAQAALEVSSLAFRERFPNALGPEASFSVETFQEVMVGNVRPTLLVLVGAVSFDLLIACANVANLMLVRAAGRRREIAVRAAVGAGRARILRQLLTESVVLALAGGVLGLGLGFIGIRSLMSINTAGLPRLGEAGTMVGMDWRVLLFTLAVSLGTGILFGLIPALQLSRTDLNAIIKDSGSLASSGFRQNKARTALVVVEVGLAVVLLVGSALLIRSSFNLNAVDPGFDAENVITMRMSLTGSRYQTSAGVEQVQARALEQVRGLPGVAAAAATCCVPMQGGYGLPFVIVGRPLEGTSHGGGGWVVTSPGYFETFGIPVVRGRDFDQRDAAGSPPVAIINERMARMFWTENEELDNPGANPLEDRLVIGRDVMQQFAGEPERQIVGIVGDVRYGGLGSDPGPMMYVPQSQIPDLVNALNLSIGPVAWVVRTSGDADRLSPVIQEEIRQVAGLPISGVQSLRDVVWLSTSRQRFNMLVMTVFGGSALMLAAVGIFGLIAYTVEQRTHEIGIRLALGAEAGRVRNMVVRQGMGLTLAGVAIGLMASFGLAQLLSSLLFGIEARDPLVFLGVPALLTLVALGAVWIPARRASRVDPLVALRSE
jgi:predicted permease